LIQKKFRINKKLHLEIETLEMLFSRGKRFMRVRHLSSAVSGLKIYPAEVTIVEVGPRDGLQNEKVKT